VAVRVKIKVDSTGGKSFKTIALVNTGFETPWPQLLLPIKAAEKLSLWPNLPTEAKIEIYFFPQCFF
jgi:predicted aspartyl protease